MGKRGQQRERRETPHMFIYYEYIGGCQVPRYDVRSLCLYSASSPRRSVSKGVQRTGDRQTSDRRGKDVIELEIGDSPSRRPERRRGRRGRSRGAQPRRPVLGISFRRPRPNMSNSEYGSS